MQIDYSNAIPIERPEQEASPSLTVNYDIEPTRVRLKQDDLLRPDVFSDIKDYMVRRHGVDYETFEPERTVDDFLSWQRSIESGNSANLVRESLFIRKADNATKQTISRAYNTFDSLEGIFAEDSDTLQGLGDYGWAILTDPITYLGLGVSKAVATVGGRAAAVGLRTAAKQAARQAMTGATGIAAKKQVYRSTMEEAVKKGLRQQSLKRAGTMGLVEGSIVGGQAYGTENVRMKGGSQDEISYFNVFASAALGAGLTTFGSVALDRIFDPAQGSKLVAGLRIKPKKEEVQKFSQQAAEDIIQTLAARTDWQEAAARGQAILGADGTLPTDLLESVILGNKKAGTQGVQSLMTRSGVGFDAPRFSYQVVDFLRMLPESSKTQVNKLFEQTTAGAIKSVDDFADMFAKTMRAGGQNAKIMSIAAQRHVKERVSRAVLDETFGNQPSIKGQMDEIYGTSWDAYFRNVWKRMLVSALPTTAVNILGSAVYVAGQTAQDVLLMPRMMFKKGGYQAQKRSIADRFKYLFSPTANREAFTEMLRIRPDALEAFQSVTNMGVRSPKGLEEVYKAFNIESKTAKAVVKGVETVVDRAQALTMVQAQDMFFKTFGLMDNLNREMLKRHGRSLEEVILKGDFNKLVSEDDLGRAVHDTLKMTFSADYTRRNKAYNNTNRYVSQLAEVSDFMSNNPITGFVFPFGRFTSNIVATTWQYSPVAWIPEVVGKIAKKKGLSGALDANQDVIAKSIVGMGAFATSFEMAKERLNSTDDPWHIVRNGPDRIDIKNVYPLSAVMLFGDVAYRLSRGESIPRDLMRDLGDQIAIGQAARDLNVVDVVEGLFTGLFGGAEDLVAGRDVSTNSIGTGIASSVGEILGGLTRPITSIDDVVGLLTGDLQTYDRRQIDVDNAVFDSFAMGATRYTSKTIDAISQMILGAEPPSDFEFQREATRMGPKEASDIVGRNISGLQTQGPRTHTEKMFEMAGIPTWTANWRSRHPEFNRLANEVIAPLLNEYARHIVRDERFINMNASDRRVYIQGRLNQINREVETRIKAGPNPTHVEWHVERSLMNERENPRTKDRYSMALRRLGMTESDPRRMDMAEKFQLNEYLESLQQFYR